MQCLADKRNIWFKVRLVLQVFSKFNLWSQTANCSLGELLLCSLFQKRTQLFAKKNQKAIVYALIPKQTPAAFEEIIHRAVSKRIKGCVTYLMD